MDTTDLKQAWFQFYRSKPIVPVPVEGTDLPTKSERTTPYCLTVERADNILIPPQLTKDIEEEYTILHRFQITLFHPPSKRFFGNTFIGGAFPPTSVVKDKPAVGKVTHCVQFNQKVFFHTTIIDNKCLVLLELVAVVLVEDVEVREAGVGWTFINLFGDSEHTDLLDETTAPELVVGQIYAGSPRAALFAPGDVLAGKGLIAIPGCEVTHTLQTHQTLRNAVHLLRENEMVGEWDVVPGLIRIPVEGGSAREEDFSPYFPVAELKSALNNPLLAPNISLFIGNLRVVVPKPLEDSLTKSLNANRWLEYDVPPDNKEASILERRITLGAHNGRGFTGPLSRHVLHPEQHATGGEGGAWRFQGSVAFAGVAAHPCFALLAQLEYLVRIPLNPAPRTETKVPVSVDIVIPLGWAIHIPYNGDSFITGTMALALRQGPDASPISNSFVFASPDVKANITLECVIHTEASAETPPPVTAGSASPQFISSSNFRKSRDLTPTTSPSPRTRPVRRSAPVAPIPYSIEPSASLPPQPPTPTQQYVRPEPAPSPQSSYVPPPFIAPPVAAPAPVQQAPAPAPVPVVTRARPRSTPPPVLPKPAAALPMLRLDPTSDLEDDATPLPTPKMNLAPVVNTAQPKPAPAAMTRANKAKLFDTNINYVDSKRSVSHPANIPQAQMEEPTEAYEIVIQFLAFSKMPEQLTKFSVPSSLRTLFFTLQFYRFPPHVTERLFMQEGDEPRLLVRSDAQKGLQVRYLAEGRSFQAYLAERSLAIDVWDGESLLYLGTATVELRGLLRPPGQKNAQITEDFDVVFKEHTSLEESRNGNLVGDLAGDSNVRGRLHLRLGSTAKDLMGLDPAQLRPVVLLEQQKPLPQPAGSKVVTRRLADTDKDLDMSLKQRKMVEPYVPAVLSNDPQQAALAEIQRRKRARLERFRRMVNKRPAARAGTQQERQADLRTIQLYRDRSKREIITRKLRLYTTTTHTIYPSYGSPCFFEFTFRNPYPKEQCFFVEFDDHELSLVTKSEEWRHYKKLNNLVTPMEEDMFDGNKLWMHPNEVVTIPFKFQSFQSGHIGQSDEGGGTVGFLPQPSPDDPIRARNISVVFVADSNHQGYQPNPRKVMCILEVRVVPQPFVVDRTFRFYQSENDFLKKVIALEQKIGQPKKYIKCSNSNVIVGYNAQNDERDPASILIKARCGPSPSVSRFCLQLFHDPFMAQLAETWQIFIHSLQRLDVSGCLGQTTKATLVLRGGANSRLVQCYSSSSEILRLNPDSSFTLIAGALNEVAMTFMPTQIGKQEIYVHVVDVEFHQLVSAYLVQTTATNPNITKTFEISLTAGKASNKKISYTNPYPFRKTLMLRTNKPNLIQFKDPRMEVNPQEKVYISVRFLPNAYVHGRTEIFLFINDAEYDKNEECIALNVEYVEADE